MQNTFASLQPVHIYIYIYVFDYSEHHKLDEDFIQTTTNAFSTTANIGGTCNCFWNWLQNSGKHTGSTIDMLNSKNVCGAPQKSHVDIFQG